MDSHRSSFAVLTGLAILLTCLWLWPAAEAETPKRAEKEAIGLPSGKVDMADYAFSRALKRSSEGSLKEAVDLMSLAVEVKPDVALYREARGDLYLALGKGDAALLAKTEYQAALKLEPGRKRAREGLVQAALLGGRFDEALDGLEGLTFGDEELKTEYLQDLVSLYIAADEPERGIAALDPHVRSAEAPLPAVLQLATLYRYKGDFDKALGLIGPTETDPKAPESARKLAGQLKARWIREEKETKGKIR